MSHNEIFANLKVAVGIRQLQYVVRGVVLIALQDKGCLLISQRASFVCAKNIPTARLWVNRAAQSTAVK